MIEEIKKGDVISITGAGGKTSLMFFLAKQLSKKGKVLLTTTTKIYIPSKEKYEKMYINGLIVEGKDKNIFVEGNSILEKKMTGLNYEEIEKRKEKYDYIIIEADGSKEKILKGWNKTEPCIPRITTITIGVINVKAIGKKIDEINIHRLELFCKLTGEKKGNVVKEETIVKYINNGDLFKGSNLRKIIYLNGVETLEELKKSLELGKKINNLYFGSMKDEWISKVKKIDAVIMASGYSKRFQGDKLFEKIDNIPMIEHSLKKLKGIPFNQIIVVGRDERVEKLSRKYKYEYIKNNKAHLGQSESIKIGLIKSNGDAIMFFTGDQPFLTKSSILRLIKEYEKNNKIIRPIVGKTPFSPVIFPQRYKKQLLKLEGDTGGRKLLRKENIIYKVNFEDSSEFIDIDTREELKKIKDIIALKNTK